MRFIGGRALIIMSTLQIFMLRNMGDLFKVSKLLAGSLSVWY